MARYIDSKYARGPKRWKRAYDNAVANPESPAAKLFFARVQAAREIAGRQGDDAQPHCFWRNHAGYQDFAADWKRQYYTCSISCTALQAALDIGVNVLADSKDSTSVDWTELQRYVLGFEAARFTKITDDRPTAQTGARCQVCAAHISDDGLVIGGNNLELFSVWIPEPAPILGVVNPPEPEAVAAPDTTRYYVADGMYYRLDQMAYIDVTERELFFISRADNGASIDFAKEYGHPLEELLK